MSETQISSQEVLLFLLFWPGPFLLLLLLILLNLYISICLGWVDGTTDIRNDLQMFRISRALSLPEGPLEDRVRRAVCKVILCHGWVALASSSLSSAFFESSSNRSSLKKSLYAFAQLFHSSVLCRSSTIFTLLSYSLSKSTSTFSNC